MKIDVLFFSRGKGWGHALRDWMIIKKMQEKSEVHVAIASYEDGVAFFKSISDLNFYQISDPLENESRHIDDVCFLIEKLQPELVIADEEELAIKISRKKQIKTIFITNFITNRELNIGCPILFAEYPDMAGHICRKNLKYIGPVFNKTLKAEEIGEMGVLGISLGGSDNQRAKLENIWLIDKILKSAESIAKIKIIGENYSKYFPNNSKIEWISKDINAYSSLQNCAVVITRGGLNTLWEMVNAGIPVISIPYSQNVNPMELKYSQCMAQRGLVFLCTYEDIRENKLKELISFVNKYSNDERKRLRNLIHVILKTDGSENAANEILGELYERKSIQNT